MKDILELVQDPARSRKGTPAANITPMSLLSEFVGELEGNGGELCPRNL